jgi:putative ABC transport system substrate-binding protein
VIALLLPQAAEAQQVIGVLAIASPETGVGGWDRILGGGLRKLGYKPGQSVFIEYRWARGDISNYPRLARELVDRGAAVIIAPCGPSLRAIREISRTMPVIAMCADESNFLGEIASLSRPGGHTTGITFLSPESVAKRLEILKEMLPEMTRLAILYQEDDPIPAHWRELERLQSRFGFVLQRVSVQRSAELEPAFEAMAKGRAQALFVFPTNRLVADGFRISELARKHRLPSVFEFAAFVEAGGLLSYGASVEEWMGRTISTYTDRILKGARPGDLPVVQPTLFELVVNLKTAREIGISVPRSILLRADRVIE